MKSKNSFLKISCCLMPAVLILNIACNTQHIDGKVEEEGLSNYSIHNGSFLDTDTNELKIIQLITQYSNQIEIPEIVADSVSTLIYNYVYQTKTSSVQRKLDMIYLMNSYSTPITKIYRSDVFDNLIKDSTNEISNPIYLQPLLFCHYCDNDKFARKYLELRLNIDSFDLETKYIDHYMDIQEQLEAHKNKLIEILTSPIVIAQIRVYGIANVFPKYLGKK